MSRATGTVVVLSLVLLLVPAGRGAAIDGPGAGAPEILVLSNRADLVSGGDTLAEIVLPDGADPGGLRVDVDGRDVSDVFALRANGRVMGVVEGLAVGDNTLTAHLSGRGTQITITNHPAGGPVFSGAHVWPWRCETEENGLGPALDEFCNAPARVEWFYRSGSGFASYDPADPPSDVPTTTTDEGNEVPYIVRRETGTMNRGIYAWAAVWDPEQPWEPWARQAGWNGKVLWPFGASSGNQYRQASPGSVLNDEALSKGFAVATHSLNVNGNNSNTVTNAESVMMLKEHVVETIGEVRYVMATGGSGGAIGQQWVANAYPGLLDGLRPTAVYPDVWTVRLEVADCVLLNRYFNESSPHLWANAVQRGQVAGHLNPASCTGWEVLFGNNPNPREGCGLAPEQQYDPESNPEGARCTTQDLQASIWGTREEDGFAKLVYDNAGVQYGLNAVLSNQITVEQFVDLNEKIGGHDIDFNFTPERREADPGTLDIAYRGGIVNDGNSLDLVPIIDSRGTGDIDPLLIHTMHHSFALRERMRRANGHADNHVIWRGGNHSGGTFEVMDRWLTAIEADDRDLPLAEKIRDNRPPEAVDTCFVGRLSFTDRTTCDTAWPHFGAPRTVAGAPMTHDVMKCALKPLDPADYAPFGVTFTDAQWERLSSAFPDGVCDYDQPPPEFRHSDPWTTYAEGPGGRPLGDPPRSTPVG